MKNFFNILFYISICVVVISGIFGFIYDYLIWDKSVVPDYIFNIFCIPGNICLMYIIIRYFFQKKKHK